MNESTNKLQRMVNALKITQGSHILCYDVASFRKVQNWKEPTHYKSSLENGYVYSQAFSRDDISEMSHFIWTSWPWFISMTLSSIYIKKREELGIDPKGWINVRNQFSTPFSSPSVADYFYFSLNCSNDKVKFQFHCSWWYTTSVSWS